MAYVGNGGTLRGGRVPYVRLATTQTQVIAMPTDLIKLRPDESTRVLIHLGAGIGHGGDQRVVSG
jgi:hypothetical protein